MTFEEAIQAIEALKPSGMKFGLARMERILSLLGNPQRRLRIIHIAGTNGKGSTARMIQSILSSAGYRTGLYSSPAVTGLRDTITIDNTAISKADFVERTKRLLSHQDNMGEAGSLSEFELTTAMAFLYFAEQHTDICVIECGLGGRDDATNIIQAPLAAVLTPISLDHTAILGNTIEEITAQKCGIIKPPCAVITSPDQSEDALGVILETASRCGATVRIPATGCAPLTTTQWGLTEFEYDTMKVSLPLTGAFQRGNALMAIETIRTLATYGYPVENDHIINGLRTTAMPCRQEIFSRNPLVLLDGAHNPQGVAALAETLRIHSVEKATLLTGMLADKDTARCMQLLAPFCQRAVCCTPDNPRALSASNLADILKKMKPNLDVQSIDSPMDALTAVRRFSDTPLLIAGSFYIASALRPALLNFYRA